MDVSTLGGVLPFEQPTVPFALITALPVDVRGPVDAELRVLEALEEESVSQPGSSNEVVRVAARVFADSVRAGKPVDLTREAAKAVAEFDARSVAAVASRLAVADQKQIVIEVAREVVPAACAAWTARVQEIAVEVERLMADGVRVNIDADELLEADDKTVKGCKALKVLLDEYMSILESWHEGRYLLDREDLSRFDVTAYFMDRLDGDERQLEDAMRLHPSSLVAAVSLGWQPWCPLKGEQEASMRRVLEARRAVLA